MPAVSASKLIWLHFNAAGKAFAERQLLHEEARILLDPAGDPVEDWVYVNLDPQPNENFLKLTATPNAPDPERIKAALTFFALNTKVEYMRARIAILRATAKAIKAKTPEAVSDLAIRYRPQSLVCWQLLRLCAPQALPSPERELEWLLGELCERLREKLRLTAGPAISKPDSKEIEELYWALATLRKSPPAAKVDVDAYLHSPAAGLSEDTLDQIAACYKQL